MSRIPFEVQRLRDWRDLGERQSPGIGPTALLSACDRIEELEMTIAELEMTIADGHDALRAAVHASCLCGGMKQADVRVHRSLKGPDDEGACAACMVWHRLVALAKIRRTGEGSK